MRKQIFFVSIFCLTLATSLYAQDFGGGQDQQFQGFDLQGFNDDGGKAWDVKGDSADVQGGGQIKLNNVNANSYDEAGQRQVNVTAETGYINQSSGNMRLEKDVIVTSEKGTQLLTESLDWSRDEDLVLTEDEVFITDDGLAVSGSGMQAHPGLNNAEIKKDVRVTVDPKVHGSDAEKVTITSDGPMTIDQGKGVAVFVDNVVAVQEGRILKADRMEVYFDQEMQTVKELICIGNVELTQGENQTYAEKAIYNAIEQRLVLSGSPKLIMVTEGEGAITSTGN
ncbi:MAG: LPS export ABC transporter periplasmic protein LptC [Candidatus Omnitrophica bacterium]|nr:LPS export ABC transporter periplasmic protein LptC [Candidatus Omnitrophota bacterium]